MSAPGLVLKSQRHHLLMLSRHGMVANLLETNSILLDFGFHKGIYHTALYLSRRTQAMFSPRHPLSQQLLSCHHFLIHLRHHLCQLFNQNARGVTLKSTSLPQFYRPLTPNLKKRSPVSIKILYCHAY